MNEGTAIALSTEQSFDRYLRGHAGDCLRGDPLGHIRPRGKCGKGIATNPAPTGGRKGSEHARLSHR
jgi:hypothetical protein